MAGKNPFSSLDAATRVGARNNVIDRTVEEIERGTPPPPPPPPRAEADAGRARRVRPAPAPKKADPPAAGPKKATRSPDVFDAIGYIRRLAGAQSNPGNK